MVGTTEADPRRRIIRTLFETLEIEVPCDAYIIHRANSHDLIGAKVALVCACCRWDVAMTHELFALVERHLKRPEDAFANSSCTVKSSCIEELAVSDQSTVPLGASIS